jgi:methylmalonyl-CoA/ethylmalonyl-CoA epimerase
VSPIRRLDHVAIAVHDTAAALQTYSAGFGLRVAHETVLRDPAVRLTYLECGNTFLQLVEPLGPDSAIGRWLEQHGEGLTHICFGVDDVRLDAAALARASGASGELVLGEGRGRLSAFVPGRPPHGVIVECTEYQPGDAAGRRLLGAGRRTPSGNDDSTSGRAAPRGGADHDRGS